MHAQTSNTKMDQAPQNKGMAEGIVTREVETRFGTVTVHKDKAIHFPQGLLGMPDKTYFCLADFPIAKLAGFKLLQCASDDELAFISLPINLQNEFIDAEDIHEACSALSMDAKDVAILLIVSVHRRVDAVNLSVNARAPIFVDSRKKVAAQFVFPNSDYAIRHVISFGHGQLKPAPKQ